MQVLFEREKMNPDLPGVILISHGGMALKIVESAEMIIGKQENIAAFGLEPSDVLDDYRQAVMDAYDAFGGNALILVDLYGGTPSNQLNLAALKRRSVIHAVSGMNLSMVMEVCTLRSIMSLDELVTSAVTAAQTGIVNIAEKLEEVINH